jgi:hypothetical protein
MHSAVSKDAPALRTHSWFALVQPAPTSAPPHMTLRAAHTSGSTVGTAALAKQLPPVTVRGPLLTLKLFKPL